MKCYGCHATNANTAKQCRSCGGVAFYREFVRPRETRQSETAREAEPELVAEAPLHARRHSRRAIYFLAGWHR